MCADKAVAKEERGWIIPIGGAEDRKDRRRVLKRFIELAGGRAARILVIATASQRAQTGPNYEDLFQRLEVGSVKALPLATRKDCNRDEHVEQIADATGVFFTGGNQLRLSTILGGTNVAKAIHAANARGVHVAGTSAGASILSEHMITFGNSGALPHAGSVRLAPGLGLTNRLIIDQHFRQRDRLGRLMTALAYNPFSIGMGLDEDTGAFIDPHENIEVVGSGTVTVVDANDLTFSSMAHAREGDPLCLLGMTVHLLVEGTSFNLHTREASAGKLAEQPDNA